MKKLGLLLTGLALVATTSTVDAQVALRAGGGMIFDGSQPGGHVSLIVPFSDKPAGLMIAADYYKKSGVTTVPITARGLYNIPAGEKADVYLGVGSGLIYSKVDVGLASTSTTKGVLSGVGGVKVNTSEKFGFFGELSLERALTSGAKNNVAGKAGIVFTLAE